MQQRLLYQIKSRETNFIKKTLLKITFIFIFEKRFSEYCLLIILGYGKVFGAKIRMILIN